MNMNILNSMETAWGPGITRIYRLETSRIETDIAELSAVLFFSVTVRKAQTVSNTLPRQAEHVKESVN